ncbi:hypothetical protein HXX76_011569 [Chlamydomonas incerta]|uniref:Pherophorin domain-containing protein n=1 Tax=Chlamydomonas incerta TaxID=51695 RepID=A0A835SUC8_CHLIN|nr:hypothetical protein HXX76_011569 [Chlamydomonas incerta]|eukprot:KAG2428449.1 hypothetical protein HXX76_011569 [Chlamydomonas incerta]
MGLSLSWAALVLAATLLAAADAQLQSGLYTSFPYCKCTARGQYSLERVVDSVGGGQYCFTIRVQAPAGCTSYCCTQADLRKIEFHVQPQCGVNNGASVSATVNGVPTRIGPAFDQPPDGPPGGTILRLTQLGLNAASANGARLCIKLKAGRGGAGCGTLEQLCVPPAGSPAGVCSAAMFDTGNGCEWRRRRRPWWWWCWGRGGVAVVVAVVRLTVALRVGAMPGA